MKAEVTKRQLQVLAYSLNYGIADAASRLDITEQTAKNLLQALYRKIGVHTMTQAAIRVGWLQIPWDEL